MNSDLTEPTNTIIILKCAIHFPLRINYSAKGSP